MATLHEYRVVRGDAETGTVLLRTTVDRLSRTLTVELPDGARATLDVVAARALHMTLSVAVYESLEPDGPWLRLERNTGGGLVERAAVGPAGATVSGLDAAGFTAYARRQIRAADAILVRHDERGGMCRCGHVAPCAQALAVIERRAHFLERLSQLRTDRVTGRAKVTRPKPDDQDPGAPPGSRPS